MSVFEAPEYDEHEKVLFVNEPDVGLKGIIAIHDTTLGPALGGCRMWPYAAESEAIRDVLRLSMGMTYKAAILDCGLGGGKSVIVGDSRTQKTPALLQAMGRAIDLLDEQYIVGEDIGTNPHDMREIRKRTRCVSCLRKEDGGYGDPAPMTALGVFSAMRAGVERALNTDDLAGVRVAVQGVGNVGRHLVRLLADAGARITICDVNEANLSRVSGAFEVDIVEPGEIHLVKADVFAPCAMGAVLNDETIPKLNASVIAGAANNQLDEPRHADMLAERDVIYTPDYVTNGGGLICCAAEWYKTSADDVPDRVRKIYDTTREILDLAAESGTTTAQAADSIAEQRVAAGRS